MVNNSLYALLNSALKEAMGESAITIKDTSSFVSAGKEVLSTNKTKEAFFRTLLLCLSLNNYRTFVEGFGMVVRFIEWYNLHQE